MTFAKLSGPLTKCFVNPRELEHKSQEWTQFSHHIGIRTLYERKKQTCKQYEKCKADATKYKKCEKRLRAPTKLKCIKDALSHMFAILMIALSNNLDQADAPLNNQIWSCPFGPCTTKPARPVLKSTPLPSKTKNRNKHTLGLSLGALGWCLPLDQTRKLNIGILAKQPQRRLIGINFNYKACHSSR